MNGIDHLNESTKDYMRQRLTGWTRYSPLLEDQFRRVRRRLGEARLRQLLGI